MLPRRIELGQFCNFCVGHCYERNEHRGEGERIMGFVLPPFQRPAVWTRRQQVRFLESLILGLPIGTYAYSQSIDNPKVDGWLIDGQQRMRAIAGFLADDFRVFDLLWSELPVRDHRMFSSLSFPAYVLNELGEKELLERYIRMNYSGTPHTAADRKRAVRRLRKPTPTAAPEGDR
jgi:hypothetical protein